MLFIFIKDLIRKLEKKGSIQLLLRSEIFYSSLNKNICSSVIGYRYMPTKIKQEENKEKNIN